MIRRRPDHVAESAEEDHECGRGSEVGGEREAEVADGQLEFAGQRRDDSVGDGEVADGQDHGEEHEAESQFCPPTRSESLLAGLRFAQRRLQCVALNVDTPSV
jgi:hypothetical protein